MFHREVLLDSVEMTDWQMVVEQWAGGRHSFPRFLAAAAARRFVTTMQYVRTRRPVTFEDHGTPWSAVARNLDITVTKLSAIAARRHSPAARSRSRTTCRCAR